MGWLTDWRRKRVLQKHRLDDAVWRSAIAGLKFVRDSPKLRDLVLQFLAEKEFAGAHGFEVTDARVGSNLTLSLKYGPNRERSIAGIKRVSKPGLRVYSQASKVPRVLGGLGVAVISTSQGLMTDREARKRNVGGEVLCYVW